MKSIRLVLPLFVIFSLLLTGCSNNNSQIGSAKPTPSPVINAPSTTSPTQTLLSKKASDSSIYKSYCQLNTDLIDQYGSAGNTNNSNGGSYLTGVCVIDLMDFNGDGIEDLLAIYTNRKYTGKNSDKVSIPQAGTYEIEIWTDINGELTQLLHEPNVGDFISFDSEYWDSDNCMVTVYGNKAGLPVIQLCNFRSDSLSYTNLYYFKGNVVTDKLSYSKKSFTLNGSKITKAVWDKNVSAYNKILLSVYLSSDGLTSADLKTMGMDYKYMLNHNRTIIDKLDNSKPGKFKVAQGSYIPLYLQVLDQTNRSTIDTVNSGYTFDDYQYSLYDIDKNGSPELIINNYYSFNVYTIDNGVVKDCGNSPFKDSCFYTNGKSGLIMYGGHMGNYHVEKVTLTKSKLTTKTIVQGETKNDYPKLSAFGLGDYKNTLKQFYTATPYLLYMFNDEK